MTDNSQEQLANAGGVNSRKFLPVSSTPRPRQIVMPQPDNSRLGQAQI